MHCPFDDVNQRTFVQLRRNRECGLGGNRRHSEIMSRERLYGAIQDEFVHLGVRERRHQADPGDVTTGQVIDASHSWLSQRDAMNTPD